MKSRKILSMILAALMVATMIPMSFAADDKVDTTDPAATTAPAEDADKTGAPAEDADKTETPDDADKAETPEDADKTEAPADADKTEAPADADKTETPAEGETAPTDDKVTVPVVVKKNAALSANSVLVNGEKVAFDAYTIDGFNYFKLRDIAAALTGSDATFDVAWNETEFCIELTTGKAYTKLNTDLVAGKGEAAVTASSTKMGILINGEKVELAGYSIGGNTYFQLRDLGEKLGFEVSWNAEAKSIGIDAKKAEAPAPADKNADPTKTEAPAEDADKTEAPADGADKTETPADGADKTETPADGADKTETPADGADKTETPVDDADKK